MEGKVTLNRRTLNQDSHMTNSYIGRSRESLTTSVLAQSLPHSRISSQSFIAFLRCHFLGIIYMIM